MYIMLCGSPPFNAPTDKEIMEKIKQGTFNQKPKEFFDVSSESCSTVVKLLEYYPEKRPSASEVLEMPCFKNLFIRKEEVGYFF